MPGKEQIEKLIQATFWRAVRESVAGVFVLIASAYFLQFAPIGSAKYYGFLLNIVSIGFILGIVWAFTISRRVIDKHSAGDLVYWREAYETQVKLLQLVPLWYAAPLTTSTLLVIAPDSPNEFAVLLLRFAIVGIVFGGVIYLNRAAANRLEAEAKQF